jgi:hypothetical protein
MKRVILASMLAFASLSLAASAQAAPSATLGGEHLTASGPGIVPACPTSAATISGLASGPYPGTFTETLSITFSHEIGLGAWGPPGSLTASFEIISGDTTITGTKTSTDVSGICETGVVPESSILFGQARGPYDATIATPQGTFSDHGSAATDLSDSFTSPTTITLAFNEAFASGPTSKDQCKDGGWRNFRQFKNQGDCVKFVQTGKL